MFYYFKFKFPFFSIYAAKLYLPTTYLPAFHFSFAIRTETLHRRNKSGNTPLETSQKHNLTLPLTYAIIKPSRKERWHSS